jgi:dCTP deaminase
MGSEAYVTPVTDRDPPSIRGLKPGGAFRIPSGQFAFLLTHEAVHVPDNALGLVALRARALKFRGLVNVSGFHVDPGYIGRLVLAVYNAGPGEIHLKQGEALFEVFFADLDQETTPYRPSDGKGETYSIDTSYVAMIAGKFETLAGLKNKIEEVEDDLQERIHSLEREQSVTRWAAALILGALIAFGVRECAGRPASAAQPPAEFPVYE